jgi:hypothetical protein
MWIKLNEYVKDPFFNLKLNKNYSPIFETGLIFIRFIDDTGINKDTGEIYISYQDMINDKTNSNSIKFINWFENKFHIKLNDNKIDYNNTEYENFYYLFECEKGQEKEKMIEISKCKYVKNIDLVDIKGITIVQYIYNIIHELDNLTEIGLTNDNKIKNILIDTNKKINSILNDYYI